MQCRDGKGCEIDGIVPLDVDRESTLGDISIVHLLGLTRVLDGKSIHHDHLSIIPFLTSRDRSHIVVSTTVLEETKFPPPLLLIHTVLNL